MEELGGDQANTESTTDSNTESDDAVSSENRVMNRVGFVLDEDKDITETQSGEDDGSVASSTRRKRALVNPAASLDYEDSAIRCTANEKRRKV